uniref:Phospholipid phosphatase 3-like n=1 Tax=Bursaphelenchus xylophilus TaxID=6326 RepID=A0A1I7SC97_BURXY
MDREHAEPEFQTDLEASQDLQEVAQCEPLPLQRYFTDGALVLAMAGGLELFCRIYGPYERGFFCDDESIRYAYKENTISWFTLAIFVTLPNILLICAVESFRMHRSGTVHEFYSTYENGRSHSARLLIRLAIFHGKFKNI